VAAQPGAVGEQQAGVVQRPGGQVLPEGGLEEGLGCGVGGEHGAGVAHPDVHER
jgi:hypothetical protein